MYENGKMRPVETIPEMGKMWIKENDGGVNSTMIYLIQCKNFYKCQCTPTQHNKLKKEKKSDVIFTDLFSLKRKTYIQILGCIIFECWDVMECILPVPNVGCLLSTEQLL
jgi:hypothetical protein